ncbi:Phenylalanine--tRNA ligase beta subunit [Chlamydiales bacterium STE3]|nr:Phenylalanine--tRNA ligase beta subunit [Chlamydiales bacterium STE3]
MKFPLSWLKEYIDVELHPQQIAKLLTSLGIEVDSFEKTALGFSNVVVGKVLEVAPHPNADKLCLAKVSDGTTVYDLVCGAPNCRAGMKTAFAMLGAVLKDETGKEFKVKKAKIRGVESSGMLCSGKELGISQDDEGIIEFADYLSEGADVAEIYADTIFEVSLTPNLSYVSSLIGIARELAAVANCSVKLPEFSLIEQGFKPVQEQLKVEVQDEKNCPRYTCRIIEDVKVGPSPDWLKNKITACGLRSVNNIVDITNYVFLELGQPLHAFDYDKISDQTIIVREAREGEMITTLDGREKTLSQGMLVVADAKRPIAIAGIMGGADSEVSESTTKIVLESAHFRSTSVRKTSKALGLQTDASRRFERGSDPNGPLFALDRAAMLIAVLCGGKISSNFYDVKVKDFLPTHILCRLSRVNSLLGTHLSMSEVGSIFQRLSFDVSWDGKDTFAVKVPTYRVDVMREVDLIEEVARLFGYDNIPRHTSLFHTSEIPHSPIYLFEREVRTRLIAEGLQEFLTCDLIGPSSLDIAADANMSEDTYIRVLNPTSVEQSILRASLLQGLIQVVKFNKDHGVPHIAGFEVGRIHTKKGDKYREQTVAGLILTGCATPPYHDPASRQVDFYDLKGMVENFLNGLNIKRFSFKTSALSTFHSGRQAAILVDSHEVGSLGEIHPSILRKLDVSERILFAEINLHDLFKSSRTELKMKPVPIYPSSERDWTVTLREQVPLQQLLGSIQRIPSNLLEEVSLKDIFRSEKIGKELKNITLHFVYRHPEKTISQEEVDKEHARIIETAQHMLEAF